MKTVRWGMIGCGAVAEVKSGPGFYKADHSALAAVTRTNPGLPRSFAQRPGVAKAYDTRETLLAAGSIEAVSVATTPSSHKPLSLLVAKAGKHVYVEKPMAMRFEECQDCLLYTSRCV